MRTIVLRCDWGFSNVDHDNKRCNCFDPKTTNRPGKCRFCGDPAMTIDGTICRDCCGIEYGDG